MALVAAAVCPHPPLLVPAIGTGVELASRAAARQAVRRLIAGVPDLVVLVGADPSDADYTDEDCGSLVGFGVDEQISLGPTSGVRNAILPLPLTVGAWLLRETGWTGERRARGVPEDMVPQAAAALGSRIATSADRVAMLVMGDGSARRSEKAPGWFDPRAAEFDAAVAAALSEADLEALLALDGSLARDLLAAGRVPWQVLAGAAASAGAPNALWSSELLENEAPFGVGYFVAYWERVEGQPGVDLVGG